MHQVNTKLSIHIYIALIIAFLSGSAVFANFEESAVIEGNVYDPHEAVIIDVSVLVENVRTGDTKTIRTDGAGRYRTTVAAGRYRLTMLPKPGYPFGYEHSSFDISMGEKVLVNFRPTPLAISTSLENGRSVERYVGDYPILTTHFIQQEAGPIRDLRVQCSRLRQHNQVFEYSPWLVASFDRLTVYADTGFFDAEKGTFVGQGNVIFEDGVRVKRATRVEIDLIRGSTRILEGAGKIKR
ncbi:MAG TPA: carboxypeptidase-like regulatory domain-containing protein [Blastocatellia bacterium]|nr:carboxypeptidase-like regulatory domain-containing protein [Blastocatellia bacterium]